MTEYIELEAAMNAILSEPADAHYPDWYAAILMHVPAADVSPVVYSYWEHKITNDEENIGICHNCKYPVSWFWGQAKYCPNCGAKMDGGAE